MSLRDVAREVGVSVSAVSLALRGSPKVSEQRRKNICEAAERLGYEKDGRIAELMEHLRANRVDRQMSKLAVIIPEIDQVGLKSYPRLQKIIRGVEEQAKESGYGTDLFFLTELKASPKRLKTILISRGIKGVIALPWMSGIGALDLEVDGLCVATAGYSVIDPMLNRACPNYLQMMDELIEQACRLGYRRIGFAMTYSAGGIGHKLFASSYLYYSMLVDEADRIPILRKRDIEDGKLQNWMERYRPDAVISSGKVYRMLEELGYQLPEDLGFAALDLTDGPPDASGVDHCHESVGREAAKLAMSDINLNQTGVPESPKVVLVDSHYQSGLTLRRVGKPIELKIRASKYQDANYVK
ncbi:LacI family DNA-binding transcriptional regulator [Pelagicoccus mobilis]|uniref:LacI family DNA-binding transcriptional regulator n=1 Tax=Pelagicoccus mobilis TaxID=415221 RepID=A0A934S3J7_9BACT|nr:LacI family DNA-binding transcriptional regulator [Pelagicoccus mobilis]MBK1880036.1 LacI family DNA-binding transcriptional regulator [Pelagicoccus mobilis]